MVLFCGDGGQNENKTTAITQNVDNKGGWETIGTEFWLDSGDLDDTKKCYNLLEQRACDYPAGFMEFRIKYIPDTEIEVFMDKPEQTASAEQKTKTGAIVGGVGVVGGAVGNLIINRDTLTNKASSDAAQNTKK